MDQDVAVDHVRGDEEHQSRDHELQRTSARERRLAQQDRSQSDQQDHVPDRICDRDNVRQRVGAALARCGSEHHVRHDHRAGDRDDREIQHQAHPRAAVASARRETQKAPEHQRVEQQVERISHRRERQRALNLIDRLRDVARQVDDRGHRQQLPRRPQPRLVSTSPRSCQSRAARGEADGVEEQVTDQRPVKVRPTEQLPAGVHEQQSTHSHCHRHPATVPASASPPPEARNPSICGRAHRRSSPPNRGREQSGTSLGTERVIRPDIGSESRSR